ncbi:MAG: hypothetical protein IJX02_08735 [Clostridia bacterium]|nr:hypothetical protein [Clostridia bacterium]
MKSLKKFLVLALTISVVLSMALLMVACGGDETPASSSTAPSTTESSKPATQPSTPGSTTGSSSQGGSTVDPENPNLVKVSVVDPQGRPVKNATIQICQGETCFSKPIVTGNDGVGTREYDLKEGKLKAKIMEIAGVDNYLVPAETGYVYFKSDSRELTIQLQLVTVNVFDSTDSAVEGAVVQLYQGEQAFKDTLVTDADGIASGLIAVSGEEISAKITEVISGGSYVLPKEATPFGIGSYDGTITVGKLVDYVVSLSTMFDTYISGAKVELFDSNDMKQATRTTDERGMAIFEELEPGNYYVKVTIVSPAYWIISDSEDGKYSFGESSELSLMVAVLSDITYTVNTPSSLNGKTLFVYNKALERVTECVVADGVATFEATNGDYIVICSDDTANAKAVIFTKDDSAKAEMKTFNGTAGSAQDKALFLTEAASLNCAAGFEAWFCVPYASGKLISFNNVVGTFTITWSDGTSTVVTAETAPVAPVVGDDGMAYFCVTSAEESSVEMSVYLPGSESTPIDVQEYIGNDKSLIAVSNGSEYLYYTYTADKDGVLSIVADRFIGISVNGKDLYAIYGDNGVYIDIPVKSGETVVFCVSNDSDSFDGAGLTFTFGELKKNYTVYAYVDFEAAEGITVILYSFDGESYTELARGVTNAEGAYVFENMDFSGDYYVELVPPQDYEISEKAAFGYYNETSGYMNHVKDGSSDYPYEVDHETGLGSISVGEGQTAWLSVYVYPSFDGTTWYITFDDANVKFTVYYADTNDDGVVDENDTPYGESAVVDGKATFTFSDNGRGYMIAITSVDGASVESSYKYATIEAEEGSSTSNAKEYDTSAGDIVESLTAGQTKYYVYTGIGSKLTVTVVGENVTLNTVQFQPSGDYSLIPAENNTLVIGDTEGAWIYFAVVADADATYELTIVAE